MSEPTKCAECEILAEAVRAASADTDAMRKRFHAVRRVLQRIAQFRTSLPTKASSDPRVVNRPAEEFYRSQLSGIVAQAQGALTEFPESVV